MDIERLYQDYNIPYATEGHKHTRPGWVNTVCPFCTGNPGLHLGYDKTLGRFVCYRCGGKGNPHYVIATLLNITTWEAKKICKHYGFLFIKETNKKHRKKTPVFRFPDEVKELSKLHENYLLYRRFNPQKIVNQWQIMGTGVSALLGKIDYRFRIIIPFVWDGQVVSFDARDITDKHINKYQACPEEKELIPHKKILYGNQEKWTDTIICVEGPTDVWRLGPHAVATSGIKYTHAQMRLLAKFKRVFVLFDNEMEAQKQAKKLIGELLFRGVDAHNLKTATDPGAIPQKEADYLVKQLIR